MNSPSHPQPAEKNEGGEGQETRAAANHAANNHEQLAEGQCRFINKTEKRKAEKQATIAAIQDCAEKLGEMPSYPKLKSMAGIRLHRILALFGNYTQAIRESGLKGHGSGHPQNIEALFEDWAEIVRKLGKVPTRTEYELHSTIAIGRSYRSSAPGATYRRGLSCTPKRVGSKEIGKMCWRSPNNIWKDLST